MARIYKLRNQVKHYEWGSPEYIPRLMGLPNQGEPWAELWMGAHAGSPSQVMLPSGEIGLDALISGDPIRYLGEKTAQRYGRLPFLFKLLAAQKPLSIQAHPHLPQAREGFQRENQAGLALDAPHRNYRDPCHKPEIICALTPFTGMCGFRAPTVIRELLAPFRAVPAPLDPLFESLEKADTGAALRTFLDALFGLSRPACDALTAYIRGAAYDGAEWDLARDFARQYPGDAAILAPFYLNVFHLEPGEAVFLEAGILHAYVRGFGVELMANSDNVLRGGLTTKHIDVPELMRILDFTPLQPCVIKPQPGCFTYPAACAEFALTVMHGSGGAGQVLAGDTPVIGIVTTGAVSVDGTLLRQGESAFIPPSENPLPLEGHYTFYAASVPRA